VPVEKLKKEFRELERDASTGRIDHPIEGSKDLSDCAVSIVEVMSKQKSTYRKKQSPAPIKVLPLKPGEDLMVVKRPDIGDRPSVGREQLY
jgi:hypothetical protein